MLLYLLSNNTEQYIGKIIDEVKIKRYHLTVLDKHNNHLYDIYEETKGNRVSWSFALLEDNLKVNFVVADTDGDRITTI